MLMRLPGVLKPGMVVEVPAAKIDLFGVMLDCCGIAKRKSRGASLHSFSIQGSADA